MDFLKAYEVFASVSFIFQHPLEISLLLIHFLLLIYSVRDYFDYFWQPCLCSLQEPSLPVPAQNPEPIHGESSLSAILLNLNANMEHIAAELRDLNRNIQTSQEMQANTWRAKHGHDVVQPADGFETHRAIDIRSILATPCSAILNSTPDVILTPLEISSYPTDGPAVRLPTVGSLFRDEMPADNIQNTKVDTPTQELPGVVKTRAPHRATMRRLSRHSSLADAGSKGQLFNAEKRNNPHMLDKVEGRLVPEGAEKHTMNQNPSDSSKLSEVRDDMDKKVFSKNKYIDNSGQIIIDSLHPQCPLESDYFYTRGRKKCQVKLRYSFKENNVLSVKLCVSHVPGVNEYIWPIFIDATGKVYNRTTGKPSPLWTLKRNCFKPDRGEEKEMEANISLVTRDGSFQEVTFEMLQELDFERGNCFKFFWEVTTS